MDDATYLCLLVVSLLVTTYLAAKIARTRRDGRLVSIIIVATILTLFVLAVCSSR